MKNNLLLDFVFESRRLDAGDHTGLVLVRPRAAGPGRAHDDRCFFDGEFHFFPAVKVESNYFIVVS